MLRGNGLLGFVGRAGGQSGMAGQTGVWQAAVSRGKVNGNGRGAGKHDKLSLGDNSRNQAGRGG